MAKYAVTFEFETNPPITVRGEVMGSSLQTLVKRAVLEAKEKEPGLAWSSVCIILDRASNSTMNSEPGK